MRDTFIFYRDWLNALNDMPDNIQLEVYKSIAKYALDGTLAELSPLAKIAFSFVKPQIDRDIDKYNKVVERNRANGRNGGRKPQKPKQTQINPKNPVGYLGTQKTQMNPKNLDNDNVNVNDNDNVIITPCSRDNSLDTTMTATTEETELNVYTKYIESSKKSQAWLERMGMNFHLTIPQVASYMDDFLQDCLCRGVDDRHKTLSDFKQHFNNWLRIRTEKERQVNNGNRQSNGAASTRAERQAEAAQLVAEILARDN